MSTELTPYPRLTAWQRTQLLDIQVRPEQRPFSGDIQGALHTLLSQSSPDIQGLALLVENLPLAFLLLKHGPLVPPWAAPDAVTLHALQVDHRQQGHGLGQACLAGLPAMARQLWPQAGCLQLSVDADNQTARRLYLKMGWVDTGEGYRGRVGYERRLTLPL